jgi:hypothetical protein
LNPYIRSKNAQNDKNDGERSFRERIEIIVAAGIWVAAVVAVGAIYIGSRDAREQREVMSEQLAAMQNQLNEMRAAERAWVGPYDASIAAEPALGEDLPIVVQYRVSGRLPASSLTSSVDAIVSEDNAGLLATISRKTDECLAGNLKPGQLAYPTTGPWEGYEASTTLTKDKISQAVIDGTAVIVVIGCFTYESLSNVHHSAFCYDYKKSERTNIQHLDVCSVGNAAN